MISLLRFDQFHKSQSYITPNNTLRVLTRRDLTARVGICRSWWAAVACVLQKSVSQYQPCWRPTVGRWWHAMDSHEGCYSHPAAHAKESARCQKTEGSASRTVHLNMSHVEICCLCSVLSVSGDRSQLKQSESTRNALVKH